MDELKIQIKQMPTEYIAHVKKENDEWGTHSLEDHLWDVANIAKQFASSFNSAEWAWLAGLWHDLGKYRPAFQKHIKKSSGYNPDASISSEKDHNKNHASTGAMYAVKYMREHQVDEFGRALAYIIAGHHAGLPDFTRSEAKGLSLDEVLRDHHFLQEALAEQIPAKVLAGIVPETKLPLDTWGDLHCWIRMAFSVLVDADFLDTEQFMQPDKAVRREFSYPDMPILLKQFDIYMRNLATKAEMSVVNQLRTEVLQQARNKAKKDSGIYTMTVPTGGGKTLSSLAFALEHACNRNKRRIIYAIPYTSIIEQTAKIFKEIFASCGEIVLEHHSNVEPEDNKEVTATRLAAENWDIPIVVTTTVQLFESLFAAKPSRCRKLHNLVNSVIVLDETQLLPPNNLKPIRHVIKLLAKHYGVTFLLTTATPTPPDGFDDVLGKNLLQDIETTEIIDQTERYYKQLRRVAYTLPKDFFASQSWEEIAEQIQQHPTVLAVVNKRHDARSLFLAMEQDDTLFHLSALMCPKHRQRVIDRIKQRLQEGQPTRVISTQLVEAGVDLDFPVVFRAATGLDSIIQAGGRCNREGKLKDANGKFMLGYAIVFVPPGKPPAGLLDTAFQTTTSILHGYQGNVDDPKLIHTYFNQLYSKLGKFDSEDVLSLLQDDASDINIQFRTAAQRFQMIEQDQSFTVFVDYSNNEDEDKQIKVWLNMLKHGSIDRWLIRKLQPYSISMYNFQKQQLISAGVIEETESGYYIIAGSGIYDQCLGFLGSEVLTNHGPF